MSSTVAGITFTLSSCVALDKVVDVILEELSGVIDLEDRLMQVNGWSGSTAGEVAPAATIK